MQQEKKLRSNENKSINVIVEELSSNNENLQESITYHEMIKVSFDSLRNTLTKEDIYLPYFLNKKFSNQKIKGWKGLQLPNLDNTGFEVSKMSGILQNMDFETIELISKIYKQKQLLDVEGQTNKNRILNINSESKTIDMAANFELFTNDILNREKMLLEKLNQTIEKLPKKK